MTTTPASLAFLGMPGGMELVIILVIVLLLFGRKIPGLARSLGSGITEFKKGLKDGEADARRLNDEASKPADDEPSNKG
ncbi:MAG: hypothetical protein DHS20C15_02660 [Planctomycetota bacterium]|nr:MAG: hypothetical protein DHS20C15_02660 [Planctomycetota bacterium]